MFREDEIDAMRVTPGEKVRLKDYDPAWEGKALEELGKDAAKQEARESLEKDLEALEEAQGRLYAANNHAILVVLQGMDASGKDGTIKHVMSGLNPQGCQVSSFKQPSREEREHDFLWRYARALPERGQIGIFNRSYYEEVLVVRVHPDLAGPLPPDGKRGKSFWEARYEDINAFERHLVRNGTVLLKLFLHISKGEQKRRFLERLDQPEKHWKFSASDIAERAYWDDYVGAYEDALEATSTEWAPWYVIPADHKWIARAAVADLLTTAIRALDLKYPIATGPELVALKDARKRLEAE